MNYGSKHDYKEQSQTKQKRKYYIDLRQNDAFMRRLR